VRDRMSDIMEAEVELMPDKLDDYLAAAASVAEELRDFLFAHHADLIACRIEVDRPGMRSGVVMGMPAAYNDPAYAGRIHNLKIASDNYINALRGNL
jgi:hypothetical protein